MSAHQQIGAYIDFVPRSGSSGAGSRPPTGLSQTSGPRAHNSARGPPPGFDPARPATGVSYRGPAYDPARPGTGASVRSAPEPLMRAAEAVVRSGSPNVLTIPEDGYAVWPAQMEMQPAQMEMQPAQMEMQRPDTQASRPATQASRAAAQEGAPEMQASAMQAPMEPQGQDLGVDRAFADYVGKVESHRQAKMHYYGHQQRNIAGVGVADLLHEVQPPPRPQMDAAQAAEYQQQYAAYMQQQQDMYVQQLASNFQQDQHLRQMRPNLAAGDPYNAQFRPQQTRAQGQESWGVKSMLNGPFGSEGFRPA